MSEAITLRVDEPSYFPLLFLFRDVGSGSIKRPESSLTSNEKLVRACNANCISKRRFSASHYRKVTQTRAASSERKRYVLIRSQNMNFHDSIVTQPVYLGGAPRSRTLSSICKIRMYSRSSHVLISLSDDIGFAPSRYALSQRSDF